MINRFLVFAMVVVAMLEGGCASAPELSSESRAAINSMKSERFVVSATISEPKIVFVETLFRGLWLETKFSTQDYSGVWSPNDDFTKYFVENLDQRGFKAVPASDSGLSLSTRNAMENQLREDLSKFSRGPYPEFKEVKLLPLNDYFFNKVSSIPYREAFDVLAGSGIKYFLEISAQNIYGNAIGYGAVAVQTPAFMRIIDVKTGLVVWGRELNFMEIYQLGGDLKKLELDGMAKTKEGLSASVKKLNFDSLWGNGAN